MEGCRTNRTINHAWLCTNLSPLCCEAFENSRIKRFERGMTSPYCESVDNSNARSNRDYYSLTMFCVCPIVSPDGGAPIEAKAFELAADLSGPRD